VQAHGVVEYSGICLKKETRAEHTLKKKKNEPPLEATTTTTTKKGINLP
jgi:hypothetical protein